MKYVASIAALVLLGGCSDTGAVKDAITDNLKDPGSAKFGEISIVEGVGGKFACASVNARNSLGGYTGEQQIKLRHMGADGWVWAGTPDEVDHQSCVTVITEWANDGDAEVEAEKAARDADAAAAKADAATPLEESK